MLFFRDAGAVDGGRGGQLRFESALVGVLILLTQRADPTVFLNADHMPKPLVAAFSHPYSHLRPFRGSQSVPQFTASISPSQALRIYGQWYH